jgi:hypothetical protein
MNKDEALKLAIEALEKIALAGMSGTGQESEEAMTEWHARQAWKFISIAARALAPIKAALAQPEQSPVAWMTESENIMHASDHARWVKFDGGKGFERFSDYVIPLYTAPVKRKRLTPGVIRNLYARHNDSVEFARAIEAYHSIKATA